MLRKETHKNIPPQEMITQWSFCTNALLSSLLSDFPLSKYRSTLITEWYQEGRFQFYLCVANVNFNKVIHWFSVQIVNLHSVYIDLNVTWLLQWVWRLKLNDCLELGTLSAVYYWTIHDDKVWFTLILIEWGKYLQKGKNQQMSKLLSKKDF